MDIPPLVPPLIAKHCGGASTECFAGDKACIADADRAGMVVVGRHGASFAFCQADSVSTWPTLASLVLALALSALATAGFALLRRLKVRR